MPTIGSSTADQGVQRRHEFRFVSGVPRTRLARRSAAFAIPTIAVVCLTASVLFLPMLLPAGSTQATAPPERIVPVTDPTQLRRLAADNLKYEGAFRLPATATNGDTFSFGGGQVAFHAERNSLFVGTRSGNVAEVSIPTPISTTTIDELPSAVYLQPFNDPTEGRIKEVAADGAALSGLLVYRGRLYGTGLIYYDANNTQAVSHFSRSLDLSERSVTGMVKVGPSGKTGFVAGYMATVPPEWQSRLGGPAITGQCCIAIISRTSWGPSAFVFDPADVTAKTAAPAEPLLYYTSEHATLGSWEGSNPTYGGSTQLGGLAVVAGTRTALFVGRNGTGPICYGNGTGDRALANTRGADGELYCFDPTNSDKGQHAYPYHYQIWAYDLGELAEVRAGRRDPWDSKPYGVWPVAFPFAESAVRIGGVSYDADGQRLFVAQLRADQDGYASRALIHVFHIQ